MDPLLLILVCVILGLSLLAAELFIPSGGIIGLAAAAVFGIAIVTGFVVSTWLGLAMLVGGLVASPFVFSAMMKLWQKTPAGRALVLNSSTPAMDRPRAPLDSSGVTVTQLRPMGEAEFGTSTFEVISETGSLERGIRVRVVGHRDDGVAVVRVT